MEHDEQDEIVKWRDEAWSFAVKYGANAAVLMCTALFDDRSIEFKLNPNPDNWVALIRSMYMLQHVKNNYSDKRLRWEQQLLQEVKDAQARATGDNDAGL